MDDKRRDVIAAKTADRLYPKWSEDRMYFDSEMHVNVVLPAESPNLSYLLSYLCVTW